MSVKRLTEERKNDFNEFLWEKLCEEVGEVWKLIPIQKNGRRILYVFEIDRTRFLEEDVW